MRGIAAQVYAYLQHFPDEHERLALLMRALRGGEDLGSRQRAGGHLAASGIVVRGTRLLTILHPALQRWIQPGGHLEPGEHPEQAALRETLEETGAHALLHPWHDAHACPVDIDVHRIAARPARREAEHLHFDFRYLLRCPAPPAARAELRTRWIDAEELADPGLRALMRKLRELRIPEAS